MGGMFKRVGIESMNISSEQAILHVQNALRDAKNFAWLAAGPNGKQLLNVAGEWQDYDPFSEECPNGILALAYELKDRFERLQSNGIPAVDFPHAALLPFDERYEFDAPDFKLNSNADVPLPEFEMDFTKEEYIQSVIQIQEHLRRGDCYEMNFCMRFTLRNVSPDPFTLYQHLYSISKAPFSAFLRNGERFLICGSPERFLKKEKNRLISQPIKGTIRRGASPAEDLALQQQLRNDPKERSENIMIVDLVRNDFSRIAESGSVAVDELCAIYSFNTVHQMISTVSCSTSASPGEILRATFPMGSMTGAPKVRVMELIHQYEKSQRGLYSGTVGYITGDGDFDLNVVIRSILYDRKNRYLSFSVGSAITLASDPEREYDECLLKSESMRRAIAASLQKG